MTKLQEMRIKNNLSQSKLAELSGVKIRMIQQYEINARNIDGAKLETLCDLANALKCKVYDIIESDELIKKVKKTT